MFSPIGYTSFLNAFKIVKAHYEKCGLDLESLFSFSFERNEGKRSAYLAKIYSQREVLERTFFQLIIGFEMFVCSSKGDVFKLDIPLHLNLIQFHHLMKWPELDTQYFDHYIDWPSYEKDIETAIENGHDPWLKSFYDMPNTSVNLFYSRETFLVEDREFSRLQSCCNGMFFPEAHGYPYSEKEVRAFNGWSLCLKAEDVSSITQEAVKEIFFRIVFEAEFGPDSFAEYYNSRKDITGTIGRPPKKQVAAEAFLRHFEWDNKPNWKLVQKVLLEKEGLDVSPKTIKRGLDEMGGDKNNE